ncbi:sensor histidine kinase [Allokutzneria sp. NRRL B-24872]|uniref:sensor histidine kinase n=1 Tax=Allokutzneria sp. NRRL B-24872 TaxID=1137961 RepID=UPI00143D294C|nr:histidine kinase [Allokutzneria sp. NRRL B-24872]
MTTRPGRRSTITSGALAATLMAICLCSAPFLPVWLEGQQKVDLLGYVLLASACAPVAVRGRFPLAALAVTTAAVSIYLIQRYPYGPVFLPLTVVVYAIGRRQPTVRAVALGVVAFAALTVNMFTGKFPVDLSGMIFAAAWIAVPLTIGIARRLVTESQARERAETELRKLDDERLRLATEVHDIVGHGLAAIQMQADIALHLADTKPEQARTALRAISSASASALAELRATLSAIAPREDSGLHAPTPGLARVEETCQRVREAGVDVALSFAGRRRSLPPDTDVVAYRLVQESLTNVVKHAAEPRAGVRIDYRPESVALTISSPHDGSPVVEGFGIRGMRRRVERLDGEFEVTHADAFTVRAVLPTPAP